MFKSRESDEERLVELDPDNDFISTPTRSRDGDPDPTATQPPPTVLITPIKAEARRRTSTSTTPSRPSAFSISFPNTVSSHHPTSPSSTGNPGSQGMPMSQGMPGSQGMPRSQTTANFSPGHLNSSTVDRQIYNSLNHLQANNISSNPAFSQNGSSNVSRVSSVGDLPNLTGNTGRRGNEEEAYKELVIPGEMLSESFTKETWDVNYREAAIFLDEGKNNDKFLHHPRNMEALPAYLLVHSRWFNALDFLASFVILCLGLFESPCVPSMMVAVPIHGSIELCSLVLLSFQMVLKTRWIGFRSCLKHKRTLIKSSSLVIMIIEAIVILVRQKNHFRITRALRPLFLLDTSVMGGVRRFIRQILQSLPPILDMMGLLLFVMLIYSVLGFYLFGPTPYRDGSPYFETFVTSFISLFVLLTTANYPDVMMPSYASNPFSAIFFISYLAIVLYFLMNLMLAVVYDAFTTIEIGKFKKLFLHKRKACQHAFKLLVTRDNTQRVSFKHFSGLVSQLSPRSSPLERMLIFKFMLSDPSQPNLSLEDFYKVYDAVQYRWRMSTPTVPYYAHFKYPFSLAFAAIRTLVKSKAFEFTIYALVFTNGVILILQAYMMNNLSEAQQIYALWVAYVFVGLYTLELVLKLIGLGFTLYFKSYWNMFDCLVTISGIVSIVLTELNMPSFYVLILRPLRLLRLFKMKKRFRDVFGTFVILLPRLNCAVIVLIFVYYFYGVIGIELFHGYELRNCCKNSTVELYYISDDNSSGMGYYYLNNFESLPAAGVTLFELTVVNNWFIIMEGFAAVAGPWSRIFFMSFYLFTMVVMTIVVAFILEAFLFRIQYKQTMNKEEELKTLCVNLKLNREDLLIVDANSHGVWGYKDFLNFQGDSIEFIGYKRRTKEELQKMMYRKETEEWLKEALEEDTRRVEEFEQSVLTNLVRDPGQRIQMDDSDSEDQTLNRQIID